ncbi:MAG TPA: SEC-C metal-binding domain-containing protein, partial [Polyangiaceae bacterium]
MAAPGRNDPCPCGSGKKYKKCCALVADVSASAARLHVLDEAVVTKLAMLVRRDGPEFGRALGAMLQDLADHSDLPLDQLVVPVAFYDLPAAFFLEDCPLRDEAGMQPLAAHYLACAATRFDARERSWIQAQVQHPAKLWEVTGVERGVALEIRNEESGETRRVLEKLGSENMRLHSMLLCRVVDFEGLSVLCGMYPRALSPRGAAALHQLLDELKKTASKFDAELAVAKRTTDLLIAFARAVEVEDARLAVPPVLQNTDGEPLLMTKDRFSFPASRRKEVLAALAGLDHCDADDEDAEDCARFHFWKEGNRQHATWDNTTMAHVEVRAGTLVLETNSVERADVFADKLAHALAGIAKRGLRDHE